MKSKFYLAISVVAALALVLVADSWGGEIEASNKTGLVKKSWDEAAREEIVEALGDLTDYLVISVHPETLNVNAVRESNNGDKPEFKIYRWRRGLPKEDVVIEVISEQDVDLVSRAMDAMFRIDAKDVGDPNDQIEDSAHPDRVLLFKRYKNVDVWDWRCLSVRSNSKNLDFKLIVEKLMSPKDSPTKAEIKDFFDGSR